MIKELQEKVEGKIVRRPWVFVGCSLLVGLLIGVVYGQTLV